MPKSTSSKSGKTEIKTVVAKKRPTRFKCYLCQVEHKQTGDVYYRPFCVECNVKMEKMD